MDEAINNANVASTAARAAYGAYGGPPPSTCTRTATQRKGGGGWDGGASIEAALGDRANEPTALVPFSMQANRELAQIKDKLALLSSATELSSAEAAQKRSLEEALLCTQLKAAWLEARLKASVASGAGRG